RASGSHLRRVPPAPSVPRRREGCWARPGPGPALRANDEGRHRGREHRRQRQHVHARPAGRCAAGGQPRNRRRLSPSSAGASAPPAVPVSSPPCATAGVPPPALRRHIGVSVPPLPAARRAPPLEVHGFFRARPGGPKRAVSVTRPTGGPARREEMRMEVFTSVRRALAITGVIAALGLAAATAAEAGCGCQKPPPPRAAVRPFVGHGDQMITLFDDRLAPGQRYDVRFVPTADGSSDSSRGKALPKRDFADGQMRTQLRVSVGDVSFGPCTIIVSSNGTELYRLGDDQFTVTAPPIALHDFSENLVRDNYRAGVGADGTVYIPVDVNEVSQATTFVGMADGFPLHFEAQS